MASASSSRPLPDLHLRGKTREKCREAALDNRPAIVRRTANEHADVLRLILVDEPQRVLVVLLLARTLQYPVCGIVVFVADGVVLVIVTPRTGHGQSHHAAKDNVDPVGGNVILVVDKPAAESDETLCRQIPFVTLRTCHKIRSQL